MGGAEDEDGPDNGDSPSPGGTARVSRARWKSEKRKRGGVHVFAVHSYSSWHPGGTTSCDRWTVTGEVAGSIAAKTVGPNPVGSWNCSENSSLSEA